MREKFMFFENFKQMADKLPDDLRLKFYDALTNYVFLGEESDDPIISALITGIKFSLDKVDGRSNNGGNHNPKGVNQHKIDQTKEDNLTQSRSKLVNLGQSRSIPLETETETETETRNGKKEMVKEKVSKFGELGFVRLTDEQHTTLREKHPNLDDAIEVLDTWLGTTGSKHRNKNHYAYFKANSWVWERLNERGGQRKPVEIVDLSTEEDRKRAEFWRGLGVGRVG